MEQIQNKLNDANRKFADLVKQLGEAVVHQQKIQERIESIKNQIEVLDREAGLLKELLQSE